MENIITKEELKIIELFRDNLFEEYTIREVMMKIDKKSYNWVFRAVKKMNSLGIINLKVKGGSSICSINLDNILTLSYLVLIENLRIPKQVPMKSILELINSVPLGYFTFIVAGSYARGKATKKSDLDVIVLVEKKTDVKKVFAVLKNKGDLMIPKLHLFVFSRDEFFKMIVNKEENYGKEIFRESVVVFGAENYYRILKEANENGFKG